MEGMHILHVTRDSDVGRGQGLGVLDVESDTDLIGCPDCGVVAVGYGRRVQVLSRRPVLRHAGAGAVAQADLALPEPSCRRGTWAEEHDVAPPQAKLTSRAAEWALSTSGVRAGSPPRTSPSR